MGSIAGSIVGSVASSVVGKALGGGKQSTTPNQYQQIPGVEFQPFTYKTGAGSVTGGQVGDHGYEWSADVAPWLQELGGIGQAGAGGLFQDYLGTAQVDPYEASQEYYQRGLEQLQPELARQQVQAQERMFGTGRLGLKLAGEAVGAPAGTGMVNPDAYGLAAGQAKSLQDLWTNSLTQGQALQTNRLNQLSQAAQSMLSLGMKPSDVERELVKEAMAQETARSNALKSGTQTLTPQESPQSVMAGQIGGLVGQGVQGMFSGGSNPFSGMFGGGSSYTPSYWQSTSGSIFSPF